MVATFPVQHRMHDRAIAANFDFQRAKSIELRRIGTAKHHFSRYLNVDLMRPVAAVA